MKKDKNGLTEIEFIKQYNVSNFDRPSVTVDNLLFTIDEFDNNNIRKLNDKKLQILLVKRDEHPCIDMWGLPGAFVKMNETLEDTSLRCLEVKANTKDVYLEQLYTFGDINRDLRTRVLSVSYMGLVDKKRTNIKETENNISWFNLEISCSTTKETYEMILDNEKGIVIKSKIKVSNNCITILETGDLAFDHAKIIFYGLSRLRNKLEYTDIAFRILEKEFTMAELQQVYEIILDKKLTKANFQRKIKDKVKSTNTYKTGGYRPALLYKYKDFN